MGLNYGSERIIRLHAENTVDRNLTKTWLLLLRTKSDQSPSNCSG